jgi:hypothetical protein
MKAGPERSLILILVVCGLLGGIAAPTVALAMSKTEQRRLESEAKKAFYSSDYEKAKDIYAVLISEFDDFIYLRNIARCYEEMKQPGPAIDGFKSYVKFAGARISVREYQEITERIAGLERLAAAATEAKSKKQSTAAPTAHETSARGGGQPHPTPSQSVPKGSMAAGVPSPETSNPSTGNVDLAPRSDLPPQPSALRPLDRAILITAGIATIVGVVIIAGFAYFRYARGARKPSPSATSATQRTSSNSHNDDQPTARPSARPGGAVFISYRRADSADVTGRIYDRLLLHFGRASVFKDVDSIPLGADFRQHLSSAVGQCRVVLAIIGRSWLAAEPGAPQRRIDDPRDLVGIEIASALERNVVVIPVLVQGATMPSTADLPSSLQALAYRNAIAVRPDPDFHQDVARLIKGIEAHLG